MECVLKALCHRRQAQNSQRLAQPPPRDWSDGGTAGSRIPPEPWPCVPRALSLPCGSSPRMALMGE